jgi:5-methylcytosine-specific restriction endonuclease McrA
MQRAKRASDPQYAERQRDVVRRRRATGRRAPSEQLRPRATPTAEQLAAREQRRLYQVRIAAARAQAAKFGATVNDLTLDDWYVILEQFEHRCLYCDQPVPLWLEHVIPLAKGGNNTRANVIPACEPCNRRKAKRPVEHFLTDRCHVGHPLYGENVYVYPDGKKRACKACRRASIKRYRAKRKVRAGHTMEGA